jgi:hypothetical protein
MAWGCTKTNYVWFFKIENIKCRNKFMKGKNFYCKYRKGQIFGTQSRFQFNHCSLVHSHQAWNYCFCYVKFITNNCCLVLMAIWHVGNFQISSKFYRKFQRSEPSNIEGPQIILQTMVTCKVFKLTMFL